MPTELKGASALLKALKQVSPDLAKETRTELVGFLQPLVKKARGFMPANAEMPSGFVKHEVKSAKFPMYDAAEARRGIGFKLTPTKPNRQGWSQSISLHNKTAAGAIFETSGRKSGITGKFTPKLQGTLEGRGKMAGRAMFKAYDQDQGKAKAAIIKALEKAADKFNGKAN